MHRLFEVEDVLIAILSYCSPAATLSAGLTCRSIWQLAKPIIWRDLPSLAVISNLLLLNGAVAREGLPIGTSSGGDGPNLSDDDLDEDDVIPKVENERWSEDELDRNRAPEAETEDDAVRDSRPGDNPAVRDGPQMPTTQRNAVLTPPGRSEQEALSLSPLISTDSQNTEQVQEEAIPIRTPEERGTVVKLSGPIPRAAVDCLDLVRAIQICQLGNWRIDPGWLMIHRASQELLQHVLPNLQTMSIEIYDPAAVLLLKRLLNPSLRSLHLSMQGPDCYCCGTFLHPRLMDKFLSRMIIETPLLDSLTIKWPTHHSWTRPLRTVSTTLTNLLRNRRTMKSIYLNFPVFDDTVALCLEQKGLETLGLNCRWTTSLPSLFSSSVMLPRLRRLALFDIQPAQAVAFLQAVNMISLQHLAITMTQYAGHDYRYIASVTASRWPDLRTFELRYRFRDTDGFPNDWARIDQESPPDDMEILWQVFAPLHACHELRGLAVLAPYRILIKDDDLESLGMSCPRLCELRLGGGLKSRLFQRRMDIRPSATQLGVRKLLDHCISLRRLLLPFAILPNEPLEKQPTTGGSVALLGVVWSPIPVSINYQTVADTIKALFPNLLDLSFHRMYVRASNSVEVRKERARQESWGEVRRLLEMEDGHRGVAGVMDMAEVGSMWDL